MKAIVTEFIAYIHHNKQATHNPDCQAGYINYRIALLAEDVSQCDEQVIS